MDQNQVKKDIETALKSVNPIKSLMNLSLDLTSIKNNSSLITLCKYVTKPEVTFPQKKAVVIILCSYCLHDKEATLELKKEMVSLLEITYPDSPYINKWK